MVPDDGDVHYPTLGPQVCDFIEEYLVFGPGDLRGDPAVIDAEKRALIYRMYEVFPQDHEQAGRRRFRRVGLSLPKGLAKTELSAWIAACELHPDAPVRCVEWGGHGEPIGGGVTDPYIPLVAYTEEQSDELAYGALRCMLDEGPLRDHFDIGLERIMRKRGDGKAVSLANAPSARDGARTTFGVCDETHWWELPRLKQSHQTMMANLPKRRGADPWMLEVTTAYEPGRGSVAEATMEYARSVADGRVKDSRLFFFHRQAAETHDLEEPDAIRAAVIEASGPAASWRDIDGICEMFRDPTADRQFLRRVWLNQIVTGKRQAFDLPTWQTLQANSPVKREDMITVGFDGAMFRDALGIVATHVQTGYQWVAGVWECPVNPPADWHVPTDEVEDVITALFEQYDVWRLYCDPQFWDGRVAEWHGRWPDHVIEWRTNRQTAMTYALQAYVEAVATRTLSHDGHAAFVRHIANARRVDLHKRDEEGKPLWLIAKERPDSPFKIDLAMAAVLSWQARRDAVASGVLEMVAAGPTFWDMEAAL